MVPTGEEALRSRGLEHDTVDGARSERDEYVVTGGRDGGARFEIRGVETDTGGEPAA